MQKPRARARGSCSSINRVSRSVARHHRAAPIAEAIVEANLHEVDVLLDPISIAVAKGRAQVDVFVAEVAEIVLSLERPVGPERLLESRTNHPAPTQVLIRLRREVS